MMSDKSLFEGAFIQRENIFSRIRGNLAAMLEPSSGLTAAPADAPVHFDMLREDNTLSRLGEQLGFAFAELRRDPSGFVKALVSPDESNPDQIRTRQAAWALTVVVPVMGIGAFLLGIALYMLIFGRPVQAVEIAAEENPYTIKEINVADMPEAPKEAERSGGGGGGGRQEAAPAMKGKLPTASLKDPILTPTTHPTPQPPSLPVMPTIKADPTKIPPNLDPNSIGDPNGVVGPPSDGPGKGGGIGTGTQGGVGAGDGLGAGPGNGWNVGGGDPRLGGGDGRDSRTVATKAVINNRPRPNYTEQARQNKTQGNVVVKVLLGANGRVKSASVVRGLPDGLNEKAIEAAYQLAFTPARNGAGAPIDSWVTVSVNFTIR
jgi:TonB family protein